MCQVSKPTVFTWANAKRVKTFRHNGKLYFGYNSLKEWAAITRCKANYRLREAQQGD